MRVWSETEDEILVMRAIRLALCEMLFEWLALQTNIHRGYLRGYRPVTSD